MKGKRLRESYTQESASTSKTDATNKTTTKKKKERRTSKETTGKKGRFTRRRNYLSDIYRVYEQCDVMYQRDGKSRN
jgi:hypothetical protein